MVRPGLRACISGCLSEAHWSSFTETEEGRAWILAAKDVGHTEHGVPDTGTRVGTAEHLTVEALTVVELISVCLHSSCALKQQCRDPVFSLPRKVVFL